MDSKQNRFVKNQAFRIFDVGYEAGEKDEQKRIVKLLQDERQHYEHSGLATSIFNNLIELIEGDKS